VYGVRGTERDRAQVMFMVCVGDARPELPPGMPPAFLQLLTECWAADPGARPTFAALMPRLRAMLHAELAAAAALRPPPGASGGLRGVFAGALPRARSGGGPAPETSSPAAASPRTPPPPGSPGLMPTGPGLQPGFVPGGAGAAFGSPQGPGCQPSPGLGCGAAPWSAGGGSGSAPVAQGVGDGRANGAAVYHAPAPPGGSPPRPAEPPPAAAMAAAARRPSAGPYVGEAGAVAPVEERPWPHAGSGGGTRVGAASAQAGPAEGSAPLHATNGHGGEPGAAGHIAGAASAGGRAISTGPGQPG